jgi:hypothetical protein
MALDNEWDLALWLMTGMLGFTSLMTPESKDFRSTEGWPAPALLNQRDPATSHRPGTLGWTPPAQLQRAAHPPGPPPPSTPHRGPGVFGRSDP